MAVTNTVDINMVKCTWLQKGSLILGSSPNYFMNDLYHWKSSKKWSNTNVNCRNTNGKSTGEIRGVARIFPAVRTFFSNLPPSPPPSPSPPRKEKYSKESKRVKWNLGNYIVIAVVLIFTLSFFKLFSFLFYFVLFYFFTLDSPRYARAYRAYR